MDILETSEHLQRQAWKIIEDFHIFQTWENMGAQVNVVGSLKTGLMVNRDIDLHIYTDKLSIRDSFSAMGKLAEKLSLEDIQYKNLINTEEECIEWHAIYQDNNADKWKFDIIHIRRGSKYDGVVEKVTEVILNKITPEIRRIILGIKYDIPKGTTIPGIEIYQAVFSGNIKNYDELILWREENPLINSLDWIP